MYLTWFQPDMLVIQSCVRPISYMLHSILDDTEVFLSIRWSEEETGRRNPRHEALPSKWRYPKLRFNTDCQERTNSNNVISAMTSDRINDIHRRCLTCIQTTTYDTDRLRQTILEVAVVLTAPSITVSVESVSNGRGCQLSDHSFVSPIWGLPRNFLKPER